MGNCWGWGLQPYHGRFGVPSLLEFRDLLEISRGVVDVPNGLIQVV